MKLSNAHRRVLLCVREVLCDYKDLLDVSTFAAMGLTRGPIMNPPIRAKKDRPRGVSVVMVSMDLSSYLKRLLNNNRFREALCFSYGNQDLWFQLYCLIKACENSYKQFYTVIDAKIWRLYHGAII